MTVSFEVCRFGALEVIQGGLSEVNVGQPRSSQNGVAEVGSSKAAAQHLPPGAEKNAAYTKSAYERGSLVGLDFLSLRMLQGYVMFEMIETNSSQFGGVIGLWAEISALVG